eukprot:3453000-Rhodomonas_salina.1
MKCESDVEGRGSTGVVATAAVFRFFAGVGVTAAAAAAWIRCEAARVRCELVRGRTPSAVQFCGLGFLQQSVS